MKRPQIYRIVALIGVLLLAVGGLIIALLTVTDDSAPAPPLPTRAVLDAGGSTAGPQRIVPPPAPADRLILRFDPTIDDAARAAYLAEIGATVRERLDALDAVVVDLAELPPPAEGVVAAAEPDHYVTALVTVPPNDPRYGDQWGLPAIGAPDAWATLPADAPTVTVAVIDSGICAGHPDLAGRVLDGYDFVDDDADPDDLFGHGCGVAGILAANIDDGLGMAGVAPNVRLMPLRVLDATGVGLYSDVAAALIYAADNGADFVNLSAGGTADSALLTDAVDYAVGRGVTVIAAAGNTGGPSPLFPARYPPVIAVGAVDAALRPAGYSSGGADIWGPGDGILVARPDGGYGYASGTSFAAPHVTGVAALEQAAGQSLRLGGVVTTTAHGEPVALAPVSPSPTPGAGRVRYIVDLALNVQPEPDMSGTAVSAQRAQIASAQATVLSALQNSGVTIYDQTLFQTVPGLLVEIDAAQADQLRTAPGVAGIFEDIAVPPATDSANVVVRAPQTWMRGYDGAGQVVVVLDTGTDFTHPALDQARVDEACFGTTYTPHSATTGCPNGLTTQDGSGAAMPTVTNSSHGTHVAGIVAGNGSGSGYDAFRGVAPGAGIIGINVFSVFTDPAQCDGASRCVKSYFGDQIEALDYVNKTLRLSHNIVSVNMSLGGSPYSDVAVCEASMSLSYRTEVANLRAANIAVIAAAGNHGDRTGISAPACLTDVISVGATTDSDTMAWFSNSATFLDLLAPGASIYSTVPGGSYGYMGGTSMATPYVAGAWAIMRQVYPTYTASQTLDRLKLTGQPVFDSVNGLTKPRIDIYDATYQAQGVVSFVQPSSSADEDDVIHEVVLWLDVTDAPPNLDSPLTVGVTYSGSAARGTDYTAPDTVTFTRAGGYPNGGFAAALPVTVLRDAVIDADETITMTLIDPAAVNVSLDSSSSTHTMTVIDTNVQATGTLRFATAAAATGENIGVYRLPLVLDVVDGPPNISSPFEATVTYGGTAVSGTDFSAPATVVFNSAPDLGAGRYTADLEIAITDRDGINGDRTLTVTLDTPGNTLVTLLAPNRFDLTIYDVIGNVVTEQMLYAAMEEAIATLPSVSYIEFALPDITTSGLQVTVRGTDGVTGVATVSIETSTGLVQSRITSLTVNGAAPTAAFQTAIERELPLLIADALNAMFESAHGSDYQLYDIVPGNTSLQALFRP